MTTISIAEFQNFLVEMPKEVQKKVLLRMSQVAFDKAKEGANRHFVTGALRQSLRNERAATALDPNRRRVYHDANRAPHAVFVNFGTRPHVITPKNKKALRWATPSGFAFAKSVQHPGYKGDAYMVRAATEAIRSMRKIVDDAMKEIDSDA